MFQRGLIICALVGMLAGGIGNARVGVYVGAAPPAPIVELRPPAPGRAFVWTAGYYRWNGSRYVWTNGARVRAPRRSHHYVAGVWVRSPRGWYFREGHWR
jgi:hypothetical protein